MLLEDKLQLIDLSWSHDFYVRKMLPVVLDVCVALRTRLYTLRDCLTDWQKEEIRLIDWEKRSYQDFYLKEIEKQIEKLAENQAKQHSKDYDKFLKRLTDKINKLKLK